MSPWGTSPPLQTRRAAHLEPFSGVEIHMGMDMDGKWMEMGAQFVKNVMDWFGFGEGHQLIDTEPS